MFRNRFSTEGSIFAYAPPSLCRIDGEGADGGGSAQPEVTDQRSAATAFEGLLNWEENPGEAGAEDTESAADEAADAGTEETPSTGDEDEGQTEPQHGDDAGAAAIEPPASWSAEEKATFAKLPPAAQATIARRESERDKLIQQRTQEIAEQRKATEAERTAIEGQRKQYLESLQVLMHAAVPEAKQFAEITDAQWQHLSEQNPAEYVRLRAARDGLVERLGKVQTELQRVSQEQAQAQQQRVGEYLAQERTRLVEKIPEFGDEAKAAALTKDLTAALTGHYGFKPEEVGQVVDHRLIAVARDAMLYRRAEAARKAAEGKRQNPPPHMQQPNAAPQQDTGKAKGLREKRAQLVRSGSTRDAAALFAELL